MRMSSPPQLRPGPPPSIDLLSDNLFKVVSLILIFVAVLLTAGLVIETWSYYGGLHAALASGSSTLNDKVDHAAVITYARGLGASFIKTSALFLGFILIFTGTLYVLRTAEANYEVTLSKGEVQGSLHTASPGLVIVTLGVILTIVAIAVKSDLAYEKTVEPAVAPSNQTADPSTTPNPATTSKVPSEPSNSPQQ